MNAPRGRLARRAVDHRRDDGDRPADPDDCDLTDLDDDERADVQEVLRLSGCQSPGARQWIERAVAEGIADPRPESMRLGRIAGMSLGQYGELRRKTRRGRDRA